MLGNSASSYYTYFNQRHNIPSPVSIDLTISISGQIELQADIIADSSFSSSSLTFRAALIGLVIDTLSGRFERVMLDMAPSANGTNFSINSGGMVTLNVQFPIPSFVDLPNLAIVGFVQNDATREVLQAKFRDIPVTLPNLTISEYTIDDAAGGNGNGRPEPGESCSLYITLENALVFAPAAGVAGVLSTLDPMINITGNVAMYPDINSGATGTNTYPFIFNVRPALTPHNVRFQFEVVANGGYYTAQNLTMMVGIPEYLLLDDDGGENYERAYNDDLNGLGLAFDVWDVSTAGSPAVQDLQMFPYVIWFTGRETQPLSTEEQNAISGYLDAGGNLFISSENLGDNLGGTQFYSQYMHATHLGNVGTTRLDGIDGDPISGGTSILLYGGVYAPDSQSRIEPDATASAVYQYSNPSVPVGALRYSGDYRLVYFAFPLECADPNPSSATPRADILSNVLNWLSTANDVEQPFEGANPAEYILCSVYPNPFNPAAEIKLSLDRRQRVAVKLFNLLGEMAAEIYTGTLDPGTHSFQIDGSGLSSGIYLVKVDTPSHSLARKLILMK